MQQQQDTLNLQLTLNEINTILTALGERPYVQVFELIQKIQGQAGAQVREREREAAVEVEVEDKKNS